MEAEENVDAPKKQGPELRASPRYALDEAATLLLIKHNATVSCRVVDISLAGCRLHSNERFLLGLHSRVEIHFKVRGLVFRFNGEARWTDDRHMVGIHFVDVTSRRRDELAEILMEVAAAEAIKAEKLLAEQRAAAEGEATAARLEAEQAELNLAPTLSHDMETVSLKAPSPPEPGPQRHPRQIEAGLKHGPVPDVEASAAILDPEKAQIADPPPSPQKTGKRERRTQSRHEIDTSAVIHLINVGSRLTGRILDLSVGGCHIRTDNPFPVGIYVRVETEFRLEGLPFRLGGVTQAIHNPHNIGIRFLDLSERKREYLEQLIEEIEEMRARRKLAAPALLTQ